MGSPGANESSLLEVVQAHAPHGIQYCFKSLETAALVLKVAISQNIILSSNPDIIVFLEQLVLLERKRYKRDSFGAIEVISFEGLHKSGKSTMADNFASRTQGKAMGIPAKVAAVREVLLAQSQLVAMAFQHISNYFLADEIIESGEAIVYISDYYHHVNAIATSAMSLQEEDLPNIPTSAFEW